MKETFLHFIWQHQYFNTSQIFTKSGDPIRVINPGFKNHDEGPDFLNAKIMIGNIEWVGNIEIHIKSSAWYTHGHHEHGAYNNVILHVVYNHDREVLFTDNSIIPTLELKHYIAKGLIEKCSKLIDTNTNIPCSESITNVDGLTVSAMINRSATHRLERKAASFLKILKSLNNDWEECFYRHLAQNFGFKVNAAAFYRLTELLPLKIIAKHTANLQEVEALLFGMAGYLNQDSVDEYYWNLKKEFQFMKHKYFASTEVMKPSEWKLLRLRPANFPTIRIAQFANLLNNYQSMFTTFLEEDSLENIKKLLRVKQSEYWCSHYLFGEKTEKKIPGLGEDSIDNIIVNTISVALAAYSIAKDHQLYLDRAIHFQENIEAEANSIIDEWKNLEVSINSAFESQGAIELYNEHCAKKACLECQIGHRIIKGKQRLDL
ncbi:MAG: DUF2851 family protein [Bacteroidota bacterium]|nr:DUF2851 family protein [Bacteroidota bacterium]